MNFSQMVTARIWASTASARCLVAAKLAEPVTGAGAFPGELVALGLGSDGAGVGDGVGEGADPFTTDTTSASGMVCVVPSGSFTRYVLPNLMTVPSMVLPFLSLTVSADDWSATRTIIASATTASVRLNICTPFRRPGLNKDQYVRTAAMPLRADPESPGSLPSGKDWTSQNESRGPSVPTHIPIVRDIIPSCVCSNSQKPPAISSGWRARIS